MIALRKEINSFCLSIIVLEVLLVGSFMEPSTGQESKVNDISGNIFFTNSTATYKIENVVTHWSIEYPKQIQFNFSMYEEPSKVFYSLDDQANVTVTGNFTLTDLSEGMHYLTLYVTDKSVNTAYQTYHVSLPDQIKPDGLGFFLPTLALSAIVAFVLTVVIVNDRRKQRKVSLEQSF